MPQKQEDVYCTMFLVTSVHEDDETSIIRAQTSKVKPARKALAIYESMHNQTSIVMLIMMLVAHGCGQSTIYLSARVRESSAMGLELAHRRRRCRVELAFRDGDPNTGE